MNSSSIFSSRVSRSSSRSRARSLTVSGGSSPACSRRYMPTQLPRVPSLIPSSFATRAIGRDVSITILTASSLNSGEKLFFGRGNYFTFPDIHPNGWTVRKPRGTPDREVGFACSRRAEQGDVGGLGDEVQGGEVLDFPDVQVGLEGEVEVVEGLVV